MELNMHDVGQLVTCLGIVSNMTAKNPCYTEADLQWAYKVAKNQILDGRNRKPFTNKGNHKLYKNTFIYDLPSIITCKYACKSCYAIKAERIRPQARCGRLANLLLLEFAKVNKLWYIEYINRMVNQIENKVLKNPSEEYQLRLHASGDIYCDEYLKFILLLCSKLEHLHNVKIYTYTKQLDNKLIDYINKNTHNLNIVKSMIEINGKQYINYGSKDYINQLANTLQDHGMKYHVCDYGQAGAHTCMKDCKACLNCDHVLFIKH